MSTLRFMRTFLAVAHHGTFAEAAEQVALTQAAVSFQMRSLEAELGRELFDRSGRLAILNAAGRELLPEIKQLLDLYERLRLPRHTSDALAGAVSVGAIVSCMGTLSKVVTRMKREHPGLDVRVLSGKASELASKVEAGELDAALIVEAGRKMASTRWTPLYEEPLVVVAHPAAAGGEDVREVLRANPFLRFDRTQRTGLQIDRVLRRLGVAVSEFLELNAIETLVELVRQETGVALLPLLNGANWQESRDLRVLALPDDLGPTARAIGMLERREHARQDITAAICQQCQQRFAVRRAAARPAARADSGR
ncbi:LysR family transcriptional regulator [Bordetella pseudohinzii]|uniref:HTH-type transcriptional activator CmpR n=1 Tax=Bordetella pseudohinzii TaxID=1331258 RepID=A0A0J6C7A9_9BORD|nr:LysR family transcriptional regulator [Bordetella pseudohinzii]ANY15939.1 LysR family transcriptional regulator [Bordetella pseudohinzii]KMM25177.1 LysR family transcriptional regulator [Bordetella pseudohinzii]KXA76187.1 LysR family transcriptional regulator [Bordetella pseudohinzii]KXA78955.1 LysR family transcriptional regulator [Bordetella pseudohinzii]CUI45846.1 HTH-type transcriptional activator CmpR [Bordetella pseudohinzii]